MKLQTGYMLKCKFQWGPLTWGFFSVFSIWLLGQNGYSKIAHQASLKRMVASIGTSMWRQDDCMAASMAVTQKHLCTSWVSWRAARPWERVLAHRKRLWSDHHDTKLGTSTCKAWSERLTGWGRKTPYPTWCNPLWLSGHRSRQGWWIKRERMKLLIFFREIR